jgi:hypothetical protein
MTAILLSWTRSARYSHGAETELRSPAEMTAQVRKPMAVAGPVLAQSQTAARAKPTTFLTVLLRALSCSYA